MSKKVSNYQLLATQFSVGDSVEPFAHNVRQTGRVVAVWPSIGMVDVAFPTGIRRFSVEDVCKVDENTEYLKDMTPPSGHTVSVAGGPFPQENQMRLRIILGHLISRVGK
jgi:hypothetical protein